jgi:transcriptional antiterminator RfaH
MEKFMTHWFVVVSKPAKEGVALTQLENQGYDVYLPRWVEPKRRRGVFQAVAGPMFPRYLFVRPQDAEQSIAPVRSTYGVSHLVRFGMTFAQASDQLVSEIRSLEARQLHTEAPMSPFKAGDVVEITEGAFRGISAKVLGCAESRVILLLELLGRQRELSFDINVCRL